MSFDTARLVNVGFSDSHLNDLRITDSLLSGCNLATTQAQRASATRVSIETSRLTGIHLSEAVLRDVLIRDCRVDLASFGFSRLTRVTFEECVLTRTDFRGARMQRCAFRRSELSGLQGVGSPRGSAMEWPDIVEMAGVWAAALGIEILDAE